MGLETRIAQMKPKQLKLLQNLMSVAIIFTFVYAFFSVVRYGANFMAFFQSGEFLTVAVLLIFLFFGWKMLTGGKLQFPGEPKQSKPKPQPVPRPRYQPRPVQPQPIEETITEKKTVRRIPPKRTETVPTQRGQPRISIPQQHYNQPSEGSWYCPQCYMLVIGNRCPRCGYSI